MSHRSLLGVAMATVLGLTSLAHADTVAPTPTPRTTAADTDSGDGSAATASPLNNVQDSQRYAIRMTGDNVRFRLSVNGIPLFSRIMHTGDVLDETFNEYLRVGGNVVEIQLERLNSTIPSNASYEVYFQSPSQIVTGEKTALYQSPEKLVLPLRHPLGVRIKTIAPLRLWKAERLTMSQEEQGKLLVTLNDLRTRFMEALSRNDNAYLATYDKPIRDEINIAYGRVPETSEDIVALRKKIAKDLSSLVNAPVESSPLLSVQDLIFTPVADGRLMQVSRIDGNPVIDVKRGPVEVKIQTPLYGLLAGVWERVR